MSVFAFLLLALFFLIPGNTYAVPPPDFIIAAASQVGAIFTILFAFLSSIFWSSRQILSAYYAKYKWICVIGGFLSIGLISLVTALWWDNTNREEKETETLNAWIDTVKKSENRESPTVSGEPIVFKNQLPLEISNEEAGMFLSDSSILFLDTRENLEYEIGNIPGSTHIRFADIKDGSWSSLSKYTRIIVICWSGMRGKEITLYLREKGINAQYLIHGVENWVASGGLWKGEVKFSQAYINPNYHKAFTTTEFQKQRKNGITIVNGAYTEKYQALFPEGYTFSTINTPTRQTNNLSQGFGSGKTFIVVCDGYISCFDAKLTGIVLEKLGNIFLGRYTEPWELLQ